MSGFPHTIQRDLLVQAQKLNDLPARVRIDVGAEDAPTAGDRVFTLSVENPSQLILPGRFLVELWVATTAFGAPSATNNSVSVGTGTVIETKTSNAHYLVLTDANGQIELTLNVTGAGSRHLCAAVNGETYGSGEASWT